MQALTPEQSRVSISLRTADRDMETAESLARHSPHLYESVGFSCQQAVEKYLKAMLVASVLPSPFIHDLLKLIDPLQKTQVLAFNPQELREAAVLNDFAVEWRYDTDEAPGYTSAELLAMAYRFRDKLRPLATAFLT